MVDQVVSEGPSNESNQKDLTEKFFKIFLMESETYQDKEDVRGQDHRVKGKLKRELIASSSPSKFC